MTSHLYLVHIILAHTFFEKIQKFLEIKTEPESPQDFGSALQCLVFVAGNILHDLLHPAGKNPAEVIDGGRIERPVFPQLVNGGTGDVVVLY